MPSANPDRTPLLHLPSPKPADPPDIPGDIKALADAIESEILTRLFQVGTVEVDIPSNAENADKVVTFGTPFPGTPHVLATSGNRYVNVATFQATASKVTIGVRRTGTGSTVKVYVRWAAFWLAADAPPDTGATAP